MTVIDLARERKFRKVLAHVAGELDADEKLQFGGAAWTTQQADAMSAIDEAIFRAMSVHSKDAVIMELRIAIASLEQPDE